MKKAEALSCASTSDRWKMPLTAATSGSTSEVMNPQAKNRQVTTTKALVTPAFRLCCTLCFPHDRRRAWQRKIGRTSRSVSVNGVIMAKLSAHLVEKPWGRTELPPRFGDTGGRRIG